MASRQGSSRCRTLGPGHAGGGGEPIWGDVSALGVSCLDGEKKCIREQAGQSEEEEDDEDESDPAAPMVPSGVVVVVPVVVIDVVAVVTGAVADAGERWLAAVLLVCSTHRPRLGENHLTGLYHLCLGSVARGREA